MHTSQGPCLCLLREALAPLLSGVPRTSLNRSSFLLKARYVYSTARAPRSRRYDPIFWFHHSGIDWLRRTWQHNNEALRPWAYGYPVVGGYKYAKVGLYDCLGCQAYDLGFDDYNLKELGRCKPHPSMCPHPSYYGTHTRTPRL